MESKKKRSTAAAISILEGLHLRDFAVIRVELVRNLPVFEAPTGTFSSKYELEVVPGTHNEENGVFGRMSISLKAFKKDESEQKDQAFSVDLEVEGFFIQRGITDLLDEDDLTDLHAHSISAQLLPLLTTQANQLILSMGYKSATLSMGSFHIKDAAKRKLK